MTLATKVVPALLGGFICIYGLVSGFVKERLFLSESLVATLFGIVIGPQAINLVDPRDYVDVEKFTLEFARYVIAIQVMAAGITLPRRYIVRKWRTMSVLLGPVMVVMWLVTAGIIMLMFEISFKQALLIASCAAPTDPILANSVVKGRYAEANVPKNVRDALSAESGINDGLGFPFLYFALYLLNESYSTGHAMAKWFYWTWCYQILLSIAIGIIVGYVARKLLRLSEAYDLIDKESFLAFSIGLSIFIVGCLQLIRSDDVLCCFIAGHSFTWDDWFREETKDAHFQEVLDGLINVSFFIYFGAIIPWHEFKNPELVIEPWRLVLCALMVLFLRRLPVVVLLTKITPAFRNYRQSIFAGWFGPIGVGAIFFAETVLEEIEKEPENFHIRSREIIQPIIIFLILSSVLVHGITLPLVYIGKVVRSRSRSFSSMSIRNGIVSRLSFINSREPNGIHGVHIPTMDSTVDISDEYSGGLAEKSERRGMSESGINTFAEGSDTADDGERSQRESDKNDDNGPAAPLDLTRTITIDETPKVNRNEMDIHYRIAATHQQYKQHLQNQAPTALEGPAYSHLQVTGGESSGAQPPRSQSAQEIREPTPLAETDSKKMSLLSSETPSEYPSVVRIKTTKHQYYTGPHASSDTDDMDHSPPSPPAQQSAQTLQNVKEAEEAARKPLQQGHGKEADTADIAAQQQPPVDEHAATSSTPESESDSDNALILAADMEIVSRHASRTATRATVMSDPEVPELAYIRAGSIGEVPTHHSSLPESAILEAAPSAQVAHDEPGAEAAQHAIEVDHQEQQQHRHHHRHELGVNDAERGNMRRIVRRRRPSDGEDEVPRECQFIGNRTNPLGRREDGELVDYDDPEDEDAEASFTHNNVDDRFVDYLTLNLGSSIKRLTSRLPSSTRRRE